MTAKPPKPTEADVLKAVRDLLAARAFAVFRRNTGAVRATHKGKERLVRFSQPGMADLWGFHRPTGRHLEVEIKRHGKEPSLLQSVWLQEAFAAGCIAFWCDSVAMAEAELDRFGV